MSSSSAARQAGGYDVAIIGAGLAGCSPAITLAKLGAHVILFEAKRYPQHKVCGAFLSPECTGLLAELGLFEQIVAAGPAQGNTVPSTAPRGGPWPTRVA